MSELKFNDTHSWIQTIWDALDQGEYPDDQKDDICTAMAWIAESLGHDSSEF